MVKRLKILVTGAAGFVGSALSLYLASKGHDIKALDNFSAYYSRDLKTQRVEKLLNHPQINFQIIDVSKLKEVEDFFVNNQVDAIFHLSAQPGVRLPLEDWSIYAKDNLLGFSNILTNAARFRVKNFLYASSSSVYGNSTEISFSEKKSIPNPVSYYGATKLANENLAKAVSGNSGMKTRGLRFFTVYGPWGRPDMVYFRILNSALSGQPFKLLGDGNVERDFTFIQDVAEMAHSLLLELDSREETYADIVNIGGGRPKSINQIIDIVENVCGRKVPYIREKADKRDVMRTMADFTYLRSLTGSRPAVPAEIGIETLYEWTKEGTIATRMPNWVNSVL